MNEHDAQDLIDQAVEELQELIAQNNFDEAQDVCRDFFGLEPDYLSQLL